MTEKDTPMEFDNGLAPAEEGAIDDLVHHITQTISFVKLLGEHRSYSLAITKLEEAKHWLRDRKSKPA